MLAALTRVVQADARLHTQGAALRRVLVDEIRECVRCSLVPSLEASLGEAFGQMELVLCTAVEQVTADASRSFDLVEAMGRRHEQVN